MCFATDEPGKAEGYHPLKHNATFALFESEAKSVPDTIYTAQNKCTGYSHRVIVSTPGLPVGHFYDIDSTAVDRKTLEEWLSQGQTKKPIDYVKYHITAFDCPHLSANYIEQMKRDLIGGEGGSAYRSQVLAEFGTGDEETMIPYSHLWKLKNLVKAKKILWTNEELPTGGLDLSRGGDETVFTYRQGNRVFPQITFRLDNTEETVEFLVEKFHELGFSNPEALIFVDCGGMGAPVYDRLKGIGWSNLRYVVNNGKPRDKRQYANKGTEMYGNMGKLIEGCEVILPDDPKLEKQIVTRYYKTINGKAQLESKKYAKSKGRPSPDRADSLALCLSNKTPSGKPAPTDDELPYTPTEKYKVVGDLTLRHVAKQKPVNAGLPTTRINPDDFDDLKSEFNSNRNRHKIQYN